MTVVVSNKENFLKRALSQYGIQIKLTLPITVCALFFLFLIGNIILNQFSGSFKKNTYKFGEILSIALASAAKQSLITDEKSILDNLIANTINKEISKESGLIYISIIRQENLSFYSSSNKKHENRHISNSLKKIIEKIPANTTKIEIIRRKIDQNEPRTVIQFLRNFSGEVGGKKIRLGTIELLFDLEEINKPVIFSGRILVLLGVIFLFFFVFILFYLSKSISNRIKLTATALGEVEKGKLQLKLNVAQNDELGSLAKVFNQMVVSLKKLKLEKDNKVLTETTNNEAKEEKETLPIRQAVKTILFSEIRGVFTVQEFVNNPDVWAQKLYLYIDSQVELIAKNNGTIDKIFGNTILASFEGKDDVIKAINASQKIAHHFKENLSDSNLNAFDQKDIDIAIGLDKGNTISGCYGKEKGAEFSLSGQAIKVASTICSLAENGEIIISESAFKEVSHQFPPELISQVKTSGTRDQIEVRRILYKEEPSKTIKENIDIEVPVITPTKTEDVLPSITKSDLPDTRPQPDLSSMLEETLAAPLHTDDLADSSNIDKKSLLEEYEEGIASGNSMIFSDTPQSNPLELSPEDIALPPDQIGQDTFLKNGPTPDSPANNSPNLKSTTDQESSRRISSSFGKSRLDLINSLRNKN